jgi:hypothetical protein
MPERDLVAGFAGYKVTLSLIVGSAVRYCL